MGGLQSLLNAATVGVANYDNVLDLEVLDSVCEHRDGVVVIEVKLAAGGV